MENFIMKLINYSKKRKIREKCVKYLYFIQKIKNLSLRQGKILSEKITARKMYLYRPILYNNPNNCNKLNYIIFVYKFLIKI